MYTGDPVNNPLDRIRIYCTDTDNDEILIDQSIIEFFYMESGQNEKQAAIKALNYLLFQIAKMGDEKVGGVYQKNSERLKNLMLVLDDLKQDVIKVGIGGVYAGGISKSDVFMRRSNPDSIKKPTETGDAFAYNPGRAAFVEDTMLESNDIVVIIDERE